MLKLSRGPEINTESCVVQAGGNRFDMVLMAAARAREIAQIHRNSDVSATVSAQAVVSSLLDIQAGIVGREYLLKVRK